MTPTNHQLRLPLNSGLPGTSFMYTRDVNTPPWILSPQLIELLKCAPNGINISGYVFNSDVVHRSYISKQGFPSPDGEETESSQRQVCQQGG